MGGPLAFGDQLRAAVQAAPRTQLDNLAKLLWRAHGTGELDDETAQGLAEAIALRRAIPALSEHRQRPRTGGRPRTPESVRRRRNWASQGWLPGPIATGFTTGEAAALAVVAQQVQRYGTCRLTIGAIAGLAGVCASTVRNALRAAIAARLIDVERRRVTGWRNLPNIVRITCRAWAAWLRHRGGACKISRPTKYLQKEEHSGYPSQVPLRGIQRRKGDPPAPA